MECPADFDCAASLPCPPQPAAKPTIDYLAKAQVAYSAYRGGETVSLMQREGATYLFYGPLERQAGGPRPTP